MAMTTIAYRIDHEDRIQSVSGPWDKFALENDGDSVCAADVQGRPIWDFVTGDITKSWLHTLIKLARVRNEPVERPYRCDSPRLKRFMRMRIVPQQDGLLRIEHELVSTEQRSIPVHFEFSRKAHVRLMLRCSICGRVQEGANWREAETTQRDSLGAIPIAYSVCDDCSFGLPGVAAKQRPSKWTNY
ncbi:MAG: hypothetical protein MI741_25035 [Rhodospirillales bacterium]|nr:hypothetical protein [Rhodospirillales bacterium]